MPGRANAADAGKAVTAMIDKGVNERAGPVAGGGMDDHAGGLVDDNNVCVFVNHIERDRFALGRWVGGRRAR